MALVNTIYQLDQNGNIVCNMRVTQAVLDFTWEGGGSNNPQNNGTNIGITATSGTDRSGSGVHVRGVWVFFTDNPPIGGDLPINSFVPILRFFNYRSIRPHMEATYNGRPCIIVSKRAETIGA